MPDGYTHVRTARKAAEAVRYTVKCPAAFAAGANGPDTLFCYQAWKPAQKRLYDLPALGHRMHNEKTGPFLRSLVRHVRTAPQIEYTMGFLSHYATDTIVHPYVEALCRPGMPYARKGGHGYFEAALDTLLHEQDTGSGMVPAEDSAPPLTGEALADIANLLHTCLKEVFDLDIPVEYLADSFYHATKLRGLFTSRFGVRRAFYWLIEPVFAGRGYITGHVTPSKMKPDLPDIWTDPFSGEKRQGDIFTLLEQAQSRSEKYMAATILAWGGQLPGPALAEQLGSMSYLEGRSTALSDPDFMPPAPEPEKTKAEDAAQAPEQETETPTAPPETETPAAAVKPEAGTPAPETTETAAEAETGKAEEKTPESVPEPAETALAPEQEPEPAEAKPVQPEPAPKEDMAPPAAEEAVPADAAPAEETAENFEISLAPADEAPEPEPAETTPEPPAPEPESPAANEETAAEPEAEAEPDPPTDGPAPSAQQEGECPL